MVTAETLEGSINNAYWYHYDIASDVLYLRLIDHRESDTVGEETDDGRIVLRHAETDQPIGLTVVNWWKRFGQGQLPDSMREIQDRIEPMTRQIAA